jgi:hypothetical protein
VKEGHDVRIINKLFNISEGKKKGSNKDVFDPNSGMNRKGKGKKVSLVCS